MAPFLGSLLLLPVSAVLVLSVAVALGLAVVLGLIGGVSGNGVVAIFGALVVGALGFVGIEKLWRARDARLAPRWLIEIDTLARSTRVPLESVGGEAMSLARAAALGVSVPDSVVLTSELVEQWMTGVRKARPGVDATTLLPAVARRQLHAFLHRAAGGKITVRPSFGGDDAAQTYPGVFVSARDIDPERVDLLVKAIVRVVDSGYGVAAAEYRQRLRIAAPLKRAVVLQRQVEADVVGSAQSRGLDGRGDSVLMDFGKPRSATTSVSFDLIDGSAGRGAGRGVGDDAELDEPSRWSARRVGHATWWNGAGGLRRARGPAQRDGVAPSADRRACHLALGRRTAHRRSGPGCRAGSTRPTGLRSWCWRRRAGRWGAWAALGAATSATKTACAI
ncbi:MAG: hypothetical protein U0263_39075 [Polyangiaceae bacterium]